MNSPANTVVQNVQMISRL